MLDTFRKLMDLLDAREKWRFWLLMGLVLLMGLANMAGVASILPFLAVLSDPSVVQENEWLAWLYGLSGAQTPLDFLLRLGMGVVIAYIGGLVFKAGATYSLMRFGAMRSHSLAQRMLSAYLAQNYTWFLGRHSSELVKNVLSEVGAVVNGVLIPMLTMFANIVVAGFLLGLLIVVNPLIALFVAVLLGGSYAAVYLLVRRWMSRLGESRLAANRARFRVAQEGMAGIKEIKILALERNLLRRFAEPSRRVADAAAASEAVTSLPRYLLEAVAFGGMMTVVLILAFLNEGDLNRILPVAGVYALAGSRLAPALQAIYRCLGSMRFGKAALDTLHADLTAASKTRLIPPPTDPIRLRRDLKLEAVTYAYPNAERQALAGLSLEIPAKATIGIVGGTGAGKTTVIDVIMGLLEPQSGDLLVDGRPIRSDAERLAWRCSIGYVPQQIFLVDASVSANIAFGLREEEIDAKAVERAGRLAELHRFVTEELPQGYGTLVGDRGVRLSGGQRQRIGIARALYRDPDVLVLDEATSALDNLTERAVMDAVGALGGTKTVIMIAHRLTTVMNCDRIYLLEKGRVAASGTYAELLETSPAFRAMAAATEAGRPVPVAAGSAE